MRRRSVLVLVPLVVLALAACSGPSVGSTSSSSGASSGPVKLGVIGSITGAASTYGVAEQNGIKMAVNEQNSAGGLLGSKVSMEIRDDKADPSTATTEALQLAQQDDVSALFGPIVNTNALAVAKISDQLAVPVLGTLGATTPVVYPNGSDKAPYKWVYRVLVSSPVQVQALVKYGMSKGLKRWAIVYENDAYGQPTVDDLKSALASAGGSLVSSQAVAVDATDATAQALAVEQAKPDVVLVWSVQAPASKVVTALNKVGLKVPVYSSNAQVSPQFYQLAGSLANGIVSTALKAQVESAPAASTFAASYQKQFGITPTLWSYASYDAAKLYFSAVKKAGTATPDKVRAALNAMTYTGITGSIAFTAQNHDGITADDVSVVTIQDQKAIPAQ